MSSTATPRPTLRRELTARPLRCRNCGADRAAAPVSICDQCLGPLDPVYDPGRPLPDANAVAAHAARAGLTAWVFIPEELEAGKVLGTSVYGPKLVRVRGTYDDVNRLCAQVADRFGWGIVNVNLRGYYGEGSKTVAYEIAEQLGWRFPNAVVAPMAGGSLLSKLRKGFAEFLDAGLVRGASPRLYGAQASGCAPIVRLVERGGTQIEPEIPRTIARSRAIGNPADGVFAMLAMPDSGGWAAAGRDEDLWAGLRFLAEVVGLFAGKAGC